MNRINPRFMPKSTPLCNQKATVQGEHYRISVLTPYIIRFEYDEEGAFEDRSTQGILNRDFEVPEFKVIENEHDLEVITDYIHVIYRKEKFSQNSLSIRLVGELSRFRKTWYFGESSEKNLKGTARTLDRADGAIPLEDGLLSRDGFSIIDDSKSLILAEDGWVDVRKKEAIDFYFLGFGDRYLECLREFYYMSGKSPMIPRYALGNWWSRYYAYSEEEYKTLMNRFEEKQIPFSVAVIDMDWHLVKIDPRYGSGWTGYTWNKELFPDPEEFMKWLHDKGMKVTLNLHPAEGVKSHEEMYESMAKELGVDYEQEQPINFDIAEPSFLEAYFKYLHHPHEENGVDFWWIDWQQGNTTKLVGLDPLAMLNHYHYMDLEREGKRPMIFSRYSGIGGQRYPIGFSGDSVISWESFDFQPYFTATASNVGYSWWSHDIGGHMRGTRDDELSTRWVQFGVFSPIMRLHSSNSAFTGKEPWNYNQIAEKVMTKYLKLRHQLVPYTYTMNYLGFAKDLPIVRPMYYHNPTQNIAYEVPNQYYFGTELIACPITTKINQNLGVARVKAWLPEGTWIDLLNGRIYHGDRRLALYRNIEDIPVLAKAGSIIPMANLEEYNNDINNPEKVTIHVFAGANGEFNMYEDDGVSMDYAQQHFVTTNMAITWCKDVVFNIYKPEGDITVIPSTRNYKIIFRAFMDCNHIEVKIGNREVDFTKSYSKEEQTIELNLGDCSSTDEIKITLKDGAHMAENDVITDILTFLNQAQVSFEIKDMIYDLVRSHGEDVKKLIGELASLDLEEYFIGALEEIILA